MDDDEFVGCLVRFGIFGVVSALSVRGFFFNEMDEYAWDGFWATILSGGQYGWHMVSHFLLSATAAKLLAGFMVGGLLLSFIFAVTLNMLTRPREEE